MCGHLGLGSILVWRLVQRLIVLWHLWVLSHCKGKYAYVQEEVLRPDGTRACASVALPFLLVCTQLKHSWFQTIVGTSILDRFHDI